jgi:hypothetical protein
MGRKKSSHTGFRNGDLFCFNCGISQKFPLPMPIKLAAEWLKGFDKTHRDCAKTWVEPVADGNDKSEQENIDWWLKNGEQGLSSQTIFKHLGGVNLLGQWNDTHPSDLDDFKRCYKLLQAIPQWKSKLHIMKTVSPVWEKLVDNWDKLSHMYEQNVKEDWKNCKKIGMYEFMQSLGC